MIDFNMLDLLAGTHEPTSSGLLKYISNAEDKIGNTPFGVMRTGGDDSYINRLFKIESGGNVNARTGSNRGLGQFGPQEEAQFGINDSNRNDPSMQARAVALERQQNTPRLTRALGREPTDAEHYIAHQQGVAGGPALLAADPNTPAWQAIRPFYKSDQMAKLAISGNVYDNLKGVPVENISAGDFTNFWRNKFAGGGGGGDTPATAQYTSGKMDNSGGIMGQLQSMLGGGQQQQRSSGIDPEIMSYLAMIGKGLSPYSELDPQAMLQSAQRNKLTSQQQAQQARQQAIDNLFRQQQLGFNERNVALSERQANEPRLMQRPDGSIILVPKNFSEGEGGTPAFKEVAPALKDPSLTEAGKYARDILGPQADPSTPEYKEKVTEYYRSKLKDPSLTEAGKYARDILGPQADLSTPEYKEKVTEYYRSKLKPELSPSDHRAIERAEDAMPGLENTLKNIQEAKDLLPNVLTGPLAKIAADLGAQFPSIASDKAKATRRLSDILQSSSIAEMSRTLKGSTTEREMDRFLRIGADVSIDPELRMKALDRVEELVKSELQLRQQRVDQMRGNKYYKPGGGRSGDSDTTKAAPADNAGALESARDAIRRGASREQVIKRLRDNGIDPSGL